jgi:hypothetical protein
MLGILLAFIALNALGGGYYGMVGAKGIPPEWLKGSPFKSYFIPSLFLFLVVGGSCLIGAVAVFRNSKHARNISFFCSGLLISWIVAQVAIIGYVSWMQPAIFIFAIVILVLAWFCCGKGI